jgi:hypothetical protein
MKRKFMRDVNSVLGVQASLFVLFWGYFVLRFWSGVGIARLCSGVVLFWGCLLLTMRTVTSTTSHNTSCAHVPLCVLPCPVMQSS